MPQYTEPVIIDGANDEIQLQVQGHTTQNEPLQTWETSAADTLAQITGDGRVQIGDIGLETDDALIEAHRDDDSAGSAGLPKRGLHSAGYLGGALTSLVSWMVQELTLIGSGSLDAVHEALRVRLTNQNSGTRGTGAKLRAGSFDVSNSGGGSGNRLPELTGLRVGVENQASAYVDQAYGVKVEINNNGNANAIYAFHAEQGIARVGDTLEVKRPASVPGTPATDIISMYPKSDGKLYAKNWSGTEYDLTGNGGGGTGAPDYILIQDQKSANTNGGSFTSGGWRTRDLNTEVEDQGNHVTLSSNQITLAPGTYRIFASAPAEGTVNHKVRWYNVTDGVTVLHGTAERAKAPTGPSQSRSYVIGKFTISSTKVFELQHRCSTTQNGSGMGRAAGFGIEIYAIVELWKEV